MLRTVEATLDADGHLRFREQLKLQGTRRVLVTLLDEPSVEEALLLAEPALAEDWMRPEEDAAWAHLQPDK